MNTLHGKKILIVDDDEIVLDLLTAAYSRDGAQVTRAIDGFEALRQLFEHRPDLVILDILMPVLDGWDTCAQMRCLTDTPIIFLTALGRETDIIRGLDSGAADYVTKPFSPKELLARSRAALRQVTPASHVERPISYSDERLTFNAAERQVFVAGEPVKLTPTEHRLLLYLLKNAGQILTYEQILTRVWGEAYQSCTEYVHVHISRLRQKLEEDPKQPRYLLGEYGLGYRFEHLLIDQNL
jgi:two-component system KDP operon response regulator KdpE